MKSEHRLRGGVKIIGIFKVVKGALLIALASGALTFVHKDVAAVLTHWAQRLNADPQAHYFQAFLVKITSHASRLPLIVIGTFFYGALFCVEGTGLLMGKRWAEYLTVIVTASFLPLEVYEIVHQPSAVKGGVIVLNLAIVIYLAIRLKKDRPANASAPRLEAASKSA